MERGKAQMNRFGPTRRGGPMFRWLGEPLAIDLANTVMVVRAGQEVDLLATPDDLRRWLAAEQDRLGDCRFALDHLAEIRVLRDAIRQILSAAACGDKPPADAVAQLNAASAAAPMAPHLTVRNDRDFSVEEVSAGGDPLARMLGSLARSAIALLTGSERERLHMCDAPSCGMAFLGQRRWCCAACGNRARAARHYRRARGSGSARAA
jgi:predicted RNA-binding Zn ribbon-like protein